MVLFGSDWFCLGLLFLFCSFGTDGFDGSGSAGYWRNQVDHVCAHLRSYTQNRASFRTLLAEPRLGRVSCSTEEQNLWFS